MKKIILFLIGAINLFSFSSCVTAVHAQDETYFDGEVDATIVVSNGTPVIVEDMIAYYVYRGWYYYPYWVNDSYYFHRYRRPLPPRVFYSWYRPIPRGYHRPAPYHYSHYHGTPHHRNVAPPPRRHGHSNIGGRPHYNGGNFGNRPSGGHHRGGGFGGRR
jgi:hypothetical protein